MTHRTLQAVLRKLADAGPPEADADLLRRFAADRDEAAFALLVQRHGRLVWAVCRHLTRSDAEADDAFQATFLVLVRNAAKVRDAGKLSAWLHGVAYRVCSKARQSARRRTGREAATATRERNGHAVPDSAWDRALAAVHEEVARLPDSLRVPFVLCCLEGKGQTEAAGQLGWKLGTLSGRLTRAKDAVLARLDARGLTLGAVAAVGLVAPPPGVAARAAELVRVGFTVPGSILQLSQGVIGMSVHQVKLLAAGLLLACGLGLTAGSGWLSTAGAQYVPPGMPQSPAERVKQLEAELAKAKQEAADAAKRVDLIRHYEAVYDDMSARQTEKSPRAGVKIAADATNATTRNDYQFVAVSDMDQTRFMDFLQRQEDKGWVYCGTTPMVDPKTLLWVFRRPKADAAKAGTTSPLVLDYYRSLGMTTQTKPDGRYTTTTDPAAKPGEAGKYTTRMAVKQDDPAAIAVEIKRLQDRLTALTADTPTPQRKELAGQWTRFAKADLPLPVADVADLLRKLGEKKFGPTKIEVQASGDKVIVFGGQDVGDWAAGVVKTLSGK